MNKNKLTNPYRKVVLFDIGDTLIDYKVYKCITSEDNVIYARFNYKENKYWWTDAILDNREVDIVYYKETSGLLNFIPKRRY